VYLQILKQIKNGILPSTDKRILVATSGGADSMVLLSLMHRVGYKITVAHCNFNLRPGDCDLDQQLVESFCKKLGIECFVESFDTVGYAKSQKISVEMAARDLRYSWFAQLKSELNIDFIAIGHHLNDNIETVLLNMTRGTGLRGLTAMTAVHSDIIRPLLFAEREHIVQYAVANDIPFREDYTNSDNSIPRNRFRNVVIPEFEKINPSFLETMKKNIDVWNDWYQFSIKQLQTIRDKIVSQNNNGVFVRLDKNMDKSTLNLVLFELLSDMGYSGNRTHEYLKIVDSQVGVYIKTENHYIVRERNGVLITDLDMIDDFQTVSIESIPFYGSEKISLTIEHSDIDQTNQYKNNSFVECIDFEKITLPLTIRRWQKGDKFFPIGMNGSKKVSDYLTDIKKKSVEKQQQLVLTDKSGIIWVIGLRLDKRYAITNQTTKFLILKWNTEHTD
jgi:tRNA(Ile)-lysidine synthase